MEWSPRMGEYLRGVYEDRPRRITLNSALTSQQARATLAHELGHAWYRHRRVGDSRLDARIERQADEYAAALLFDAEAYARAERMAGPHPGALARELDVTPAVVVVWQRMLDRGDLVALSALRQQEVVAPVRCRASAHKLSG